MTAILGISAFYHDSAAALVVDGQIVAAAQEERFTRKKHDPDFPARAVAYCLREAGLAPAQIDYVAYYEKPLAKFERLLETYIAFAPRGFRSFCMAMSVWLKDKLHLRRTIRRALPAGLDVPLLFTDHHQSHAASAFFPSPFDEAAILTLDGVGEWSTTTWGVGRGNTVRLIGHLAFPHSLGLLYSAFTYYCGFKVNSGEYKLMGLAPFGRPVHDGPQLGHVHRLGEIVGGALLDGLDGGLHVAMAGDHHHLGLRGLLPGLAQNGESVQVGHLEVGQDDVEIILGQQAGAFLAADSDGAFVADPFQALGHGLGVERLVVDDQHLDALAGFARQGVFGGGRHSIGFRPHGRE